MDGMPESVSAVMRTTLTNLVAALGVFHQINGRKDAQPARPISSDRSVLVTVLTSAGKSETFSEL